MTNDLNRYFNNFTTNLVTQNNLTPQQAFQQVKTNLTGLIQELHEQLGSERGRSNEDKLFNRIMQYLVDSPKKLITLKPEDANRFIMFTKMIFNSPLNESGIHQALYMAVSNNIQKKETVEVHIKELLLKDKNRSYASVKFAMEYVGGLIHHEYSDKLSTKECEELTNIAQNILNCFGEKEGTGILLSEKQDELKKLLDNILDSIGNIPNKMLNIDKNSPEFKGLLNSIQSNIKTSGSQEPANLEDNTLDMVNTLRMAYLHKLNIDTIFRDPSTGLAALASHDITHTANLKAILPQLVSFRTYLTNSLQHAQQVLKAATDSMSRGIAQGASDEIINTIHNFDLKVNQISGTNGGIISPNDTKELNAMLLNTFIARVTNNEFDKDITALRVPLLNGHNALVTKLKDTFNHKLLTPEDIRSIIQQRLVQVAIMDLPFYSKFETHYPSAVPVLLNNFTYSSVASLVRHGRLEVFMQNMYAGFENMLKASTDTSRFFTSEATKLFRAQKDTNELIKSAVAFIREGVHGFKGNKFSSKTLEPAINIMAHMVLANHRKTDSEQWKTIVQTSQNLISSLLIQSEKDKLLPFQSDQKGNTIILMNRCAVNLLKLLHDIRDGKTI